MCARACVCERHCTAVSICFSSFKIYASDIARVAFVTHLCLIISARTHVIRTELEFRNFCFREETRSADVYAIPNVRIGKGVSLQPISH